MALNLLDANDRPGTYPNSWYAATATELDRFPLLEGETKADVVIVGAGYTGLSAALHLAEAGRDVVLVEAQRVGFGASGRNGGQLGSGQRKDQVELEAMLGLDHARHLWDLAEESKALVANLVSRYDMTDVYLKWGLAWAASHQRDVNDLHRYADHMADTYNHPMEKLDFAAIQALCPSPDYKGGVMDRTAGHLHPLNLALGLAKAAHRAGVRIFEGSRVTSIETNAQPKVTTSQGSVVADHMILACNGYLGDLSPEVAGRVMPINNFVIATKPLEENVHRVLTEDVAISDARFVVNYFRLSHDKRLLFGGGETYGYRFPNDIAALVRKPMSVIFPHLQDVQIDYAWGGTLAITMKRLPYLARITPLVLSSSGYSGHGVGTATHAGLLMAKAIEGETDGFDAMSRVPSTPFPGGPAFRNPLLVLAMTWYSLRDRLGF